MVRDLEMPNASVTGASDDACVLVGGIGSIQISNMCTCGVVSIHASRHAMPVAM
jgi:hypothetical protein